MAALVALDSTLGLRPEDAVSRDAERLLQLPDVVLGLRRVGAGGGPRPRVGGERERRGEQGHEGEQRQ